MEMNNVRLADKWGTTGEHVKEENLYQTECFDERHADRLGAIFFCGPGRSFFV